MRDAQSTQVTIPAYMLLDLCRLARMASGLTIAQAVQIENELIKPVEDAVNGYLNSPDEPAPEATTPDSGE